MKRAIPIALLLVSCNWSITGWDPGEPYSGSLPPYFSANLTFSYRGENHYVSIRAMPDSLVWWTSGSDSIRYIAAVTRPDSSLRILLPANEYAPNIVLNGLTAYDGHRISYYGDVYVAAIPKHMRVGRFLGTFYTWRP